MHNFRIQSNGKINGKKPAEKDPNAKFIPDEICYLIEVSLLSLVGAEKLDKEFCGEKIASKLRTKFNNAIINTKKVKKKKTFLIIKKPNKNFIFCISIVANKTRTGREARKLKNFDSGK